MGIKDYLLGPGDEVEVKFFQQGDLNTVARVDGSGMLTLPFLKNPIVAKCRTDNEITQDVTTAYARFFKNPQISVRVTGRYSRPPVAVFGAVRDAQRIQALRQVRLNEVISFAGGTTEKANGTIQVLHTEKVLCPAPGDPVEVEKPTDALTPAMSLYRISDLIMGKPDSNPFIRPGDIVTVMEAEPIYVTGSVVAPQSLYLKSGMTLQRALAMVGGPTKAAKSKEITIYRQDPVTGKKEQPIVVDYTAIKKQLKPDIELKPYDIIDVPQASAFSGARLGETLANAVTGGIGSGITTLPLRVLY
jgi:polysaccharide export outer membrane protein